MRDRSAHRPETKPPPVGTPASSIASAIDELSHLVGSPWITMTRGSPSKKKRHEDLERQKRLAAAIDMENMCADETEAKEATSVSGAHTAPSETSSKPEPEPRHPQQPEPTCSREPQPTPPMKQRGSRRQSRRRNSHWSHGRHGTNSWNLLDCQPRNQNLSVRSSLNPPQLWL